MNIVDYIQNVFQIVVNKENELQNLSSTNEPYNEVIYIQFDQPLVDQIESEHLEALLFERLLMSDEDLKVNSIKVKRKSIHNQTKFNDLNETNPIIYLFECFQRLSSINFKFKEQFKNAVLAQATKYLCNIYSTLDRKPLLVELFDKYYFEADDQLLKEFIRTLGDDQECDLECLIDVLKDAYYKELCARFSKMEFSDPNLFKTINYLKLLTSNSKLSLAFIKLNSPWYLSNFNFNSNDFTSNSLVLKTLMGNLLSISSLPKYNQPNFRYFIEMMGNTPDQIVNQEKTIGYQIFKLVNEVHFIFLSMLKQKEVREEVLNYIGLVLYCFKDRSKLWMNDQLPNLVLLSDGFILNFLHVILLLCKPFAQAYSDKLLKIDSRYCMLPALPLNEINKNEMEKIHLRDLDQDSYLVSKEENEIEQKPAIDLQDKNNYNFMTEIFFFSHRAIQIGFKSCYERLLKVASSLSELSNAAQINENSPNSELIKRELNNQLTKFYSTKCIVCQQDFVQLLIKFNLASATWLTNLAMHSEHPTDESSTDHLLVNKFYPFKLKVDVNLEETQVPKLLQFVPEFICENVVDSFMHVLRFADSDLVFNSIDFEPLLTFILSYIASPHKMKNPHTRAKLAEILEELKPKNNVQNSFRMSTMECKADIFKTYEHKQYLVPCLIHVFVSIELTGQSVDFYQKFPYRRSIYAILEYLWTEPQISHIYRQSMIDLSDEAVRLIENTNPPLFLRFINLMTNDAIFMLDEALENMACIKTLQNEKSTGQWTRLNRQDRAEKERELYTAERKAKWSNMMSKMMVTMLYYLTCEIKTIFCHPILVDRLVSMLNYFIGTLVGPKQKDFKVKSSQEYYFDPANIVFNISRIYVNLGHRNNNKEFYEKFCLAVINDTRSYTPELIPSTEKVLWKTKGNEVMIIEQLIEVDNEIKKLADKVKKEEIDIDEIPEEFLDPILTTLMENPVKLPSGNVVDKSTIARHLLSDQTDPFNRAPLTMEMLEPDVELKARIEKFVKEYHEKRREDERNANEQNNEQNITKDNVEEKMDVA